MLENDETPIVVRSPPLERQPDIIDLQAPGTVVDPPSEQEARVAAAVFARQERESEAAAAIMAMWVAGGLLPEMINDMTAPIEEDEVKKKKKTPKLPKS